jgi:hypothetical protein
MSTVRVRFVFRLLGALSALTRSVGLLSDRDRSVHEVDVSGGQRFELAGAPLRVDRHRVALAAVEGHAGLARFDRDTPE